MAESGLNISVSEPRTISSADGYHWFPTMLFRLQDGGLLLGFSVGPDKLPDNMAQGMPHAFLKSVDDGANWSLLNVWQGRLYNEAFATGVLADGTLLGASMHALSMNLSGEPYLFEYRSHDSARSWEGPREVPFIFPPDVVQPADSPLPGRLLPAAAIQGNIVQLPNGDLLRIVDAKFKGDQFSRVCLFKSTDDGSSWRYVSTIADPNDIPRNFNESYLLVLPESRLLCVMRTDLDGPNPMYQAKSTDGGQNWSKPVPVGVNGVRPQMVRISNGVIACSYGRLNGAPSMGDQVMFSVDEGETWTQHTSIYHGSSTGYTCLLEVRPGELLLGYDVLGSGWTRRNSIMMVSIQVERI